MNVRTLCLAILHHQEATGYEIRKLSTEGKYAYFVDASFGSIYPALAKLEDEGLVSCRLEHQDGKPARKVYSMNDAGRDALRAYLQEEPTPDIFRSEFLLIGMCADLLEEGDLERALNVHVSQVENELRKLDEMASELSDASSAWLPAYGKACMQAQLEWLHSNREMILTAKCGCPSRQQDPPETATQTPSGDPPGALATAAE